LFIYKVSKFVKKIIFLQVLATYLTYVVQQYNMGDEKKKETKIEKKEIEEKEED
jgi:hypothetical protein